MILTCWDFCFIDDVDNKLIAHGFNMKRSIRMANRGERIQMHKYNLNDTWYIINWDNISFVSERICFGDSSCPVYLDRMQKIDEQKKVFEDMSKENWNKLVVEQEKKKQENQ